MDDGLGWMRGLGSDAKVVMSILERRHSIRRYTEETVDTKKLKAMLRAANLAPSSVKAQPARFIIVDDKEIFEKIIKYGLKVDGRKYNQWLKSAPLLIVACLEETPIETHTARRAKVRNPGIIDVSIAFEHLILMATALGLGTCWVTRFNETEMKKILKIPEGVSVVALTPVGYAEKGNPPEIEEKIEARRWLDVEDIVFVNSFGNRGGPPYEEHELLKRKR